MLSELHEDRESVGSSNDVVAVAVAVEVAVQVMIGLSVQLSS